MATRTPQELTAAGLAPTYYAAASGDKVPSGDHVFIHVINADAAPTTLTITTPATYQGVAVADVAVTVAAGTEKFVGPLSRQLFGDPTDSGLVAFAWSNTTAITFAALYMN